MKIKKINDISLYDFEGLIPKEKVNSLLNKQVLVAYDDERLVGFLVFEHKLWESDIFKLKIFALNDILVNSDDYDFILLVVKELLSKFNEITKQECVNLVSGRIDSRYTGIIHALVLDGFLPIETYATFEYKPIKDIEKHNTFPPNQSDVEAVVKIAEKSFVYSRFHSDPRLEKKYADLSRGIWIRNSCMQNDSRVLVTKDGDIITGFVSIKPKKDFVSLDLIAVDPNYQGRGVGQELIKGCLALSKELGYNSVRVGTQTKNIPSVRMYENAGFKLVKSEVTLHKHLIN